MIFSTQNSNTNNIIERERKKGALNGFELEDLLHIHYNL